MLLISLSDRNRCVALTELSHIIVALWLINDAMNGYKAARHAQKAVYNRDLSFIDYMVMNHPIMTICIAILLLLAVICKELEWHFRNEAISAS